MLYCFYLKTIDFTEKQKSRSLTNGFSTQMVPQGGIELPTRGFSVHCSTDWATEAWVAQSREPNQAKACLITNGDLDGIRTHALRRDRAAC